jgi:hypothetical protein
MDRFSFTGTFAESGIWYTDSGFKGPLESNIRIEIRGEDVHFSYEDGSVHIAVGAAAGPGHYALTGNGVTGVCLVGALTLMLDYRADIEGRVEHNVDQWTFTDKHIHRSGLIRQTERLIWFEALMSRQPDPD